MTTPVQQQQAPPQQPQADHDLAEAVLAALAAYVTVSAIVAALRSPFRAVGVGRPALTAAVTVVADWPHEAMEGTGPASRWAVRTNLTRRAQFLIHAARRIQGAVTAARSRNEPVTAAIADAVSTERRYLAQHVAASQGRTQAASAADGMADQHGPVLGWRAHLDANTSPGCRSAHGKNFRADHPPMVEGHSSLPGAVHPHCRCEAVPPWPGGKMLS